MKVKQLIERNLKFSNKYIYLGITRGSIAPPTRGSIQRPGKLSLSLKGKL